MEVTESTKELQVLSPTLIRGVVRCNLCGKTFKLLYQWTNCPHNDFLAAVFRPPNQGKILSHIYTGEEI